MVSLCFCFNKFVCSESHSEHIFLPAGADVFDSCNRVLLHQAFLPQIGGSTIGTGWETFLLCGDSPDLS